jgi:VWFA-related protein
MKKRSIAGVLLLVSSIAIPCVAQQSSAQAADAHHILLDVVVTDKSSKPVTGLTQQDFTVLDNNRPSAITEFHPHNAADVPAGQVDPSTEVIFIFDEANASYEKTIYARQGIENYLKQNNGQLVHPVSIGLFTDSGLQLQMEPTIDGNALAAALEQQGQTYRAIDRGAVNGGYERMQLSLDAMNTLMVKEQTKPGRKMVIWISPGWPLLSGPNNVLTGKQEQQVFSAAVRLSAALRQSRITLYSVDPLGAASTGEHSVFYQNFTKGLAKLDGAEFGDLGLQVLVTQTGGRAIFGNDPIANSINHELSDLNAYYTLSIDSAPAERPNQYHQIDIKTNPPNLKARTRTGYYAEP